MNNPYIYLDEVELYNKIELLKIFYNGIPVLTGLYAIGIFFEGATEAFFMIPLLTINYFLL